MDTHTQTMLSPRYGYIRKVRSLLSEIELEIQVSYPDKTDNHRILGLTQEIEQNIAGIRSLTFIDMAENL